MFVKATAPRHFSIIVFGLTQIALDLEVLRHLIRHEYPFHTFWHTYLGATVIAAVLTVLGKPASQWIKTAWNHVAASCRDVDLSVSVRTTWAASFTGAFVGAYSHILLDSLFHPDIEPLQPWSATNRLRGVVNPDGLQAVCVVLGIAGLAWFLERERRKRNVSRLPGPSVGQA